MSRKAGNLLWNRVHVTFPANVGIVDVDTGIQQASEAIEASQPNFTQRLQIIPLAPTDNWAGLQISEPTLDPVTNTLHVIIQVGLVPEPPFQLPPLNVLFWDPHTLAGPGDTDTYNP